MLLTGPNPHISIQYMDYVEIFNVPLDLSAIYLLVLVGVELPLCVAVTPCCNLLSGAELSIRLFCIILRIYHLVELIH